VIPVLSERLLELPRHPEPLVYEGGDGPPLVWFHGLGGVDPADPVLNGLAERFAVSAPLTPGFRDLGELDQIDDIHDLAIYYDDLLDALGVEQAVIAGHSFGAMVAAEVAAHYPHRASQVVLVSPFGLWDDARPVADLFALTAGQMPDLLYVDPSKAPSAPDSPDGQPDIEALVALAQSMTTLAKFMWPIPERGLARRLPRITAPALVVYGAQDRFVPVSYADDFVSALGSASSTLVEGAGHMVTIEAPDQVLSVIDEFLGATTKA
jgi:pimeloyl-ACP methyl ester carboxylesterase